VPQQAEVVAFAAFEVVAPHAVIVLEVPITGTSVIPLFATTWVFMQKRRD
jgi:hypothetical protein